MIVASIASVTIDTAVSAIMTGAYDFIEKPFKADRLLLVVDRAIEADKLKRENASLRPRLLNDWGTRELARGRHGDAAGFFARAVELDTITHGANHGFVAMSLLHLAEAQIAARSLRDAAATLERAASPPMMGPMVNPTPNAAPTKPIACERRSPGVTSARNAWLTFTVAPNPPEMTRERKRNARLGARPNRT